MAARKKPEKRKPSERAGPRPRAAGFQPSAPEVRLVYAEAGRDTYDAISEQLAQTDAPEIVIGEAPAGRETLSAIADELAMSVGRPTQTTLPYGDRISNAPGARTPKRGQASPEPEIVVSHGPAGRDTLSAISEEVSGVHATVSSAAPEIEITEGGAGGEALPAEFEIFEMATFVVRGREIARLSSEALRLRFVQDHLLHRLPTRSMENVERVDVTPWTVRGTVVVRVWCRVPKAGG